MRENEFGQPIDDDLGLWEPPDAAPEHKTIHGRHMTLEPMQRTQHAIPLFHAFKRSENSMWTYLPLGPFIDAAELGQLLDSFAKLRGMNAWTVKVDDVPVGFLAQMRARPDEGVIEIGWVTFSEELQRTPASTEALFMLIDHAFASGYRRVEWKCDALNAKSRRAAERLGFLHEGILAKLTHYKGRNRDTAWYGLTNDMWPDIEPDFQRWLDPSNFDENGEQKTALGR